MFEQAPLAASMSGRRGGSESKVTGGRGEGGNKDSLCGRIPKVVKNSYRPKRPYAVSDLPGKISGAKNKQAKDEHGERRRSKRVCSPLAACIFKTRGAGRPSATKTCSGATELQGDQKYGKSPYEKRGGHLED